MATPINRPGHPARDGGALGVVLVVMLMVSILGMGLVRLGGVNAVEASRAVSAEQAFWAAEAGIRQATATARRNQQALGLTLVFPSTPVSWTGQTVRAVYEVDVTNLVTTPPSFQIVAEGVSQGRVTKAIEVEVRQLPAISMGLFGDEDLELKPNIKIYSYDASVNPTPSPGTSTGEADAGSNAQIDFAANPNFVLDGALQLGADVNEETYANTACTGVNCPYYESTAEEVGYVNPDPLGLLNGGTLAQEFSAAMIANDNASATIISGTTLSVSGKSSNTLASGTYYLTSGEISNHAEIYVDVTGGPVHIFLSGSLTIDSHAEVRLVGGTPTDFRIYANGTSPDTIYVQPQLDFEGFIYAPDMTVHIQPRGDFKGAIWAGTLELWPGGVAYVDTDLLKYGAFNAYEVGLFNWREVPRS